MNLLSTTSSDPSFDDVRRAAERIHGIAHRTPVMTCSSLSEMAGAKLFFKCENFQKVGAFKFRGATNAVLSLSEEEARHGVATHSSGNHAAALALAARMRGIAAHVIMPLNAPRTKVIAVEGYGARITFCEATLAARESTLERIVAETGAVIIHPYNDVRVIAGQGTAALELLEDVPSLDVVMTPVGGGGLLSGTAIATAAMSPGTRVIAAEPAGADDAQRSFRSGSIVPSLLPSTIADGLLTSLGDKTFAVIRSLVHDIVTAREETIIVAMRHTWERMKIIIEPSAALPLAVLLENTFDHHNLRIGIILSGGNLDLERLPWIKSENLPL